MRAVSSILVARESEKKNNNEGKDIILVLVTKEKVATFSELKAGLGFVVSDSAEGIVGD